MVKIQLASSGNRTRAARVAGEHSTTEPTMLVRIRSKSLSYIIVYFGFSRWCHIVQLSL